MNILVFETSELTVTADELNKLDQDIDYEDEFIVDYINFDEEGFPLGFKPGKYRLYRPEHVSKTNPALSDLSVSKID